MSSKDQKPKDQRMGSQKPADPNFSTMNHLISLDHIGVAVSQVEAHTKFWETLGWSPPWPTEIVPEQKVRVAMLETSNQARVELLEASDPSSVIAKFLSKRGPGIHHICFRVKNIEGLLQKLKTAGVQLINETPVRGAHHCQVAFVHPNSTGGVLVELSEKRGED